MVGSMGGLAELQPPTGRRWHPFYCTPRASQQAHAVGGEQGIALRWQFAEAVDQFLPQSVDFFGGFPVGRSVCKGQPFVDVRGR